MTDKIDDILVIVPQGAAAAYDGTEEEKRAQRVLDACADFFSDVSMLMRKLVEDLPDDLKGWFPEIAGGALQAQTSTIIRRLNSAGDTTGERTIAILGEQLADRAVAALAAKHAKSDRKTTKE